VGLKKKKLCQLMRANFFMSVNTVTLNSSQKKVIVVYFVLTGLCNALLNRKKKDVIKI